MCLLRRKSIWNCSINVWKIHIWNISNSLLFPGSSAQLCSVCYTGDLIGLQLSVFICVDCSTGKFWWTNLLWLRHQLSVWKFEDMIRNNFLFGLDSVVRISTDMLVRNSQSLRLGSLVPFSFSISFSFYFMLKYFFYDWSTVSNGRQCQFGCGTK